MPFWLIDTIQLLLYGLVLGSIIALGAIGVSLVFGILRFAHFAHGDLMTVGAYATLVGVAAFGLPVWAAAPAALAAGAALAVAVDRTVYYRLRRTRPIILLIASFGIALILRSAIQIVGGTDNRVYESGVRIPWRLGDFVLRPDQVMILFGSVLLITALHLFLQHTRTGKAMRAMADDPDLALVTGIPTERIVMWTWILAGLLAGAAGLFLALDTRLHPTMGWNLLLPVFAAAILGGIGRPYGAIAGGLVIGVAQEMSTLFVAAAYKPAVAFALLVAMLIVRPSGLFAGR